MSGTISSSLRARLAEQKDISYIASELIGSTAIELTTQAKSSSSTEYRLVCRLLVRLRVVFDIQRSRFRDNPLEYRQGQEDDVILDSAQCFDIILYILDLGSRVNLPHGLHHDTYELYQFLIVDTVILGFRLLCFQPHPLTRFAERVLTLERRVSDLAQEWEKHQHRYRDEKFVFEKLFPCILDAFRASNVCDEHLHPERTKLSQDSNVEFRKPKLPDLDSSSWLEVFWVLYDSSWSSTQDNTGGQSALGSSALIRHSRLVNILYQRYQTAAVEGNTSCWGDFYKFFNARAPLSMGTIDIMAPSSLQYSDAPPELGQYLADDMIGFGEFLEHREATTHFGGMRRTASAPASASMRLISTGGHTKAESSSVQGSSLIPGSGRATSWAEAQTTPNNIFRIPDFGQGDSHFYATPNGLDTMYSNARRRQPSDEPLSPLSESRPRMPGPPLNDGQNTTSNSQPGHASPPIMLANWGSSSGQQESRSIDQTNNTACSLIAVRPDSEILEVVTETPVTTPIINKDPPEVMPQPRSNENRGYFHIPNNPDAENTARRASSLWNTLKFRRSSSLEAARIIPNDFKCRFSEAGTTLLVWDTPTPTTKPGYIARLIDPFDTAIMLPLRRPRDTSSGGNESGSLRLVAGGTRAVAAVVVNGHNAELLYFDENGSKKPIKLGDPTIAPPLALAVSRDDKLVAVGCGATIQLYEILNGKLAKKEKGNMIAHSRAREVKNGSRRHQTVNFSASSEMLIAATQEMEQQLRSKGGLPPVFVRVWDCSNLDSPLQDLNSDLPIGDFGKDTGLSRIFVTTNAQANTRVFLAAKLSKKYKSVLSKGEGKSLDLDNHHVMCAAQGPITQDTSHDSSIAFTTQKTRGLYILDLSAPDPVLEYKTKLDTGVVELAKPSGDLVYVVVKDGDQRSRLDMMNVSPTASVVKRIDLDHAFSEIERQYQEYKELFESGAG